MNIRLSRIVSFYVAILLVSAAFPVMAASDMTASLEPLYLYRSTKDVPLTIMDNLSGTDHIIVLDTKDAELDWGGGLNLKLKKDMGGYAWEGGLMYLHHSGSASTAQDDNEPYYPYLYPYTYDSGLQPGEAVDIEPYEAAWQHSIEIESDLWSLEVNRIQKVSDEIQWLFGARVFYLDDELKFTSIDEAPSYLAANPGYPQFTGELKTETQNKLYGLQAGVMGARLLSDKWQLSGIAKLGVYANHQTKDTDYLYLSDYAPFSGAGATFNDSQSETHASTVTEAGVNLGWLLSKSTTLSLGYTAMYLTGVANVEEQMPLENTVVEFSKFDNSGNIFYHGIRLGLSIRF